MAIQIAVLAFELERLVVVVGSAYTMFQTLVTVAFLLTDRYASRAFVQLPYDFWFNLITASFARSCCSLKASEFMLLQRERRPLKRNNSDFLIFGQMFRSMYRYSGTSGTLNVPFSGTRGTCQMYPLFRSLAMFR
jgi:hypothetical protein